MKTKVECILRWSWRKDPPARIHLFKDQKIIYVEIPKAGCTSVKFALKEFRGDWKEELPSYRFHVWFGYTFIPRKDLKGVLLTKYKDWTKFTVVRNPYDRFLSLYAGKIRKDYPDDSFDVIILAGIPTPVFSQNPLVIFKNFARILKKGGVLKFGLLEVPCTA